MLFYRFLTFRRCAILSTLVVNYVLGVSYPDTKLIISTACITIGAVLAGVKFI